MIQEESGKFEAPQAQRRVARFGRIVFSRLIAALPVMKWTAKTIQTIEAMEPSSERNLGLLLLNEAQRRPVKEGELVFEKIPSPEEAASPGADLTLLNSFLFIDSHSAEGIYPAGQRLLDAYKAKTLPAAGPLALSQVTSAIPRSSPARDELLDRCEAKTVEGAQALLESYWSPAAAYSKAYQISRAWMGPQSLPAISAITAEFPSLKRRMIGEWTDRFGIEKERYPQLLQDRDAVDVIDLYKGGLFSQGGRLSNLALCLATFAVSLSRGKFSLMSFQELEGETDSDEEERRERESKFDDDLPEGVDEGFDKTKIEAKKKAERQRDFFKDYYPLLPEEVLTIAQTLEQDRRFSLHAVPFVDDCPAPNPRFERKQLVSFAFDEARGARSAKLFFNFMEAMGQAEAAYFYENLLLGENGLVKDEPLFEQLENIFLQGIGLLLQEKEVPLSRIGTVKEGMRTLLANQEKEVRAKVWARILAGIAERQSIGEITRQAVNPTSAEVPYLEIFSA